MKKLLGYLAMLLLSSQSFAQSSADSFRITVSPQARPYVDQIINTALLEKGKQKICQSDTIYPGRSILCDHVSHIDGLVLDNSRAVIFFDRSTHYEKTGQGSAIPYLIILLSLVLRFVLWWRHQYLPPEKRGNTWSLDLAGVLYMAIPVVWLIGCVWVVSPYWKSIPVMLAGTRYLYLLPLFLSVACLIAKGILHEKGMKKRNGTYIPLEYPWVSILEFLFVGISVVVLYDKPIVTKLTGLLMLLAVMFIFLGLYVKSKHFFPHGRRSFV